MNDADDNGRDAGQDNDAVGHAARHEDSKEPRAQIKALIQRIGQYKDINPVLQRSVQYLYQELCAMKSDDATNDELLQSIQSFVQAGALGDTIKAMIASLACPSFLSSGFDLLILLLNYADEFVASALQRTDVLSVLEKIVHNVAYQDEPACIQRGMNFLSKFLGSFKVMENDLWTRLVSMTAQAMLTKSEDAALQLECLRTLKLLLELRADAAVPTASANIVLKTLDHCNQHPNGVSASYASTSVTIIFRLLGAFAGALNPSNIGISAPILAAVLHQYHVKIALDDKHKRDVETLIRKPLQDVVLHSLARLTDLTLPSTESNSEEWATTLQTAAMKLLLAAVWREEARVLLQNGGVAVLANVLTAKVESTKAATETALAQTLHYVSMHWPDEMWNDIRVSSTGLTMWVALVCERCEDENDRPVQYLLEMVKTLLPCEGFREAFAECNGVTMFQAVLHKCQVLPLCTRLVVSILVSVPRICPTTFLPELCYSVAETMFYVEANRSSQLECVKALTSLISEQFDNPTCLSSQHIRDIVRVMRSRLQDGLFIAELLKLVVNTLVNKQVRALFIDQGILQVVSLATCIHHWNPRDPVEWNARWIVCDVAHKLDVSRNLSILEPRVHMSNGLSLNVPPLSTEALDSCCCMIGALAHAKTLISPLIQENAICHLVGMLRYAKQELATRSEGSFLQLVVTCFYSLNNIVNAPIVTQDGTTITTEAVDKDGIEHSILSQLSDAGAIDAIIGCLEEALRVKKCPSLLMHRGCRLLQTVLTLPVMLSIEAESRWIAVATSTLQKDSTSQRSREALLATTLLVLSREKQSIEAANGQHLKMMKVIVEVLDDSIQRERSCTLSHVECFEAIRVLEEILKASSSLSDYLVSRCLSVLGKVMNSVMLSSSATAKGILARLDTAVALFATPNYVKRLMSRLDRCMAKRGGIESTAMMDMVEDFQALEAILFSKQARTTIDSYHRLFDCLTGVTEHISAHAQTLGDRAPFYVELGCLASQFLAAAQREETINTALCYFAEDTAWHSLRWLAALEERGSSEFLLIVEFVLLRIVSGYTVLEQTSLMELMDALNYLARCSRCREIITASCHIQHLQDVVWELVHANVALSNPKCETAVPLLGIISSFVSLLSDNGLSFDFDPSKGETLVQLCLKTLDYFVSASSVGLTDIALMEEALEASSTILQHCIRLDVNYVHSIIQHRATQNAFNVSISVAFLRKRSYDKWCLAILNAVVHSHGLPYAEKVLQLSSNPSALLVSLIAIAAEDAVSLPWKCIVDCFTTVSTLSAVVHNDCSVLFVKLRQESTKLLNGKATVTTLRCIKNHVVDALTQLSFKYGQLRFATLNDERGGCLQEIAQSGMAFYELFVAASSFDVHEYSAVIGLHLKIARLAGIKFDAKRSTVEKQAVYIRHLLHPTCISDEALADYLDFAAVVYLSPGIRAAVWQFIDASANVLSRSMQKLATKGIRPPLLEKSLVTCFSSLRVVYASRWTSGEVESALELLKICSRDKWAQDLLLESVFVLPQGLVHLFELAQATSCKNTHVTIMAFLFQHVKDNRHKTQHINELELNPILSTIKRNLAGKVGVTCQERWKNATGSEMLRGALETLQLFARQKDCAILCSDLGGISILHDVLCAPSQYVDTIYIALKVCCYLASYGADLAHENSTFALELLFVFVETNAFSSRSRLAFFVLEFFLAIRVTSLSLSLIQQCRTQIVPALTRSHEEMEMFVQQLYITRQKFVLYTAKSTLASSKDASLGHRVPLDEDTIRSIVLSSCRSIVQCVHANGVKCYVNVKTSEKSAVEPLQYTKLREAIDQLSFVLDDLDMVMSQSYVSALVPALSEVLMLHATTTAMMCTVIQVLAQIAFVNPSIVLSNKQLDIPALFASCSLHHRSSLPFARQLCLFCSSIGVGWRAAFDDESELTVSLVSLLLDLLHNWKSDLEIVDLVFATAYDLIEDMTDEQFERLDCGDTLALFNTAVLPYTSNSPTSWSWLKCVSAIVGKLSKLVIKSAQATISTVLDFLRMFMAHSYMVNRALVVLQRIYKGNRHPLWHLVESNGINVLLECLKLHANEESICRSCLGLLVNLTSHGETSHETVDQLLATTAAASILLVSKKHPDSPSICGICIELLHQMVESVEYHPKDIDQMPALPGEISRKQSELWAHLLEADVIPLLFDLMDNYSSQGSNPVLEALLALLKSLTKEERLRESAEVLHGIQELQQTIDRIWEKKFKRETVLVELAIDCLINMACSDQAFGHGWKELPMWLLQLAESIHNLKEYSTGMCIEKVIGILGRLAVESAVRKTILPKGLFAILELLIRVGDESLLEQALFGLLCTLCEDIACTQTLIVYGIIPIAAKRMISHIYDTNTLMTSLCFFDTIVLNSGESYPALQDESLVTALKLVILTYPDITGGPMYRIASTILEKVSALDYQATRTKPVIASPAKVLKPQLEMTESEKILQNLLLEGAKFRVIWEARPDMVESIHIKLAPSGDYLLFQRKSSSSLPRLERVFVSQVEVCPQRPLVNPTGPPSPSKKALAQSLLRENFEGDCILRLKVRDEDVLIKTSSIRERVYWGQALQWLVLHRELRSPSMSSPSRSPSQSLGTV